MVQDGTSLHRDEGEDKRGPVELAVVRNFSHNIAFFFFLKYHWLCFAHMISFSYKEGWEM